MGGGFAIYLTKPISATGRFVWSWFLVPGYGSYIKTQKWLRQQFNPTHNKIITILSTRYTVHIIVGFLILGIAMVNIQARSKHLNEINPASIMAQITTDEFNDIIVEEAPKIPIKKYYLPGYVDPRFSLQKLPAEVQEALRHTSELLTVQGGTALMRSNLDTVIGISDRTKVVEYLVQSGDTVSTIAEKFGISINTILWENRLSARSLLRLGQKLTILPTSGITYRIKRGDSAEKLAKKYSISADEILRYNQLSSSADLVVNQKIILPGAKPISAPANQTSSVSAKNFFTTPSTKYAPSSEQRTGFVWPTTCRRITQYYRYRHTGLDIACGMGIPIYAANSGIIDTVRGGWSGGYGNNVIINHGGGIKTLYGHMSVIHVKAGQTVTKGQVIGLMGNTGRSTGPHLHFEVRVGNSKVNPLSYIR